MVDDPGDEDLDALELDAFDRVTFTDEELTQLALDAEPFDPNDPEIERFGDVAGSRPGRRTAAAESERDRL